MWRQAFRYCSPHYVPFHHSLASLSGLVVFGFLCWKCTNAWEYSSAGFPWNWCYVEYQAYLELSLWWEFQLALSETYCDIWEKYFKWQPGAHIKGQSRKSITVEYWLIQPLMYTWIWSDMTNSKSLCLGSILFARWGWGGVGGKLTMMDCRLCRK